MDGEILKHLPGLLTVLHDGGFSEQEAFDWLFREDDSLPGTPVQALRDDRHTEVTRRAQALALRCSGGPGSGGTWTYVALLAGCLVVTAPLELVLRVRVYARWRRLLLAVLPGSSSSSPGSSTRSRRATGTTRPTSPSASGCPAGSRSRRCCSSSSSRCARCWRWRRCGR